MAPKGRPCSEYNGAVGELHVKHVTTERRFQGLKACQSLLLFVFVGCWVEVTFVPLSPSPTGRASLACSCFRLEAGVKKWSELGLPERLHPEDARGSKRTPRET